MKKEISDFFSGLFKGSGQKKAVLAVGGYESAAVYSRDRSYIYTSEEKETPSARTEILRITRYLVNNFPLLERILSVTESYGVGGGIIANACTDDPNFNTANTKLFDSWGSSVFCSSNNQYNFYELQKLIARELLIAGEVFLVLIKSPNGYPQLMPVESERVRHSGKETDKSIDGLYVDDFGKVTAFNIFTGDKFQVVDASNVIHIMRHKRIGQLRGVSPFAASLNTVRDIKDLEIQLKRNIKTHALLAAVIERKTGEAGNGLTGDFTKINSSGAPTTARSNIALERALPGASVLTVNEGEKVNLLTSDNPSQNILQFIELLTREVCLNISLPFEFLVNADKLTGTGVRFVLSDAAFYFANLQTILIDGAFQRIYGWVTASMISAKKIAPPVNDLPYAVSYTRPQSVTIDPTRVTNAEIALLQNSLTNYETFYSARGRDWRHELRQHALEEKYLDELSMETGVDISRLRTLAQGAPPVVASEELASTEGKSAGSGN